MKKYLHILPACFLFYAAAHAQQKDTFYVTDFGAVPYSYENCVTQIQAAIDECKRTGAKVLSLPEGRYDIWPEGAIRKEYYISNTSTEQECPDHRRKRSHPDVSWENDDHRPGTLQRGENKQPAHRL